MRNWIKLPFSIFFVGFALAGSNSGFASDGNDVVLQALCSSSTPTAIPGGYIVRRTCGGRQHGGIGATLAAANDNAQAFANAGIVCSLISSNVSAFAGGYRARFSCSSGVVGDVGGVGSTATDVGLNALEFAIHAQSGGSRCVYSSDSLHTFAVGGGYVVGFACGRVMRNGVGSTVTDAANNALGFIKNWDLPGGDSCIYPLNQADQIVAFAGGYLLNIECGNVKRPGVGSNLTDAAALALDFALYRSHGGRACSIQIQDIRAVGGGYEVRYSCGGASVIGVGSTATDAGRDALVKAEARWPAS